MNHPLLLIVMSGVGVYCFWIWRADLKANHASLLRGVPQRGFAESATMMAVGGERPAHGVASLPGATPASVRAVSISVVGILVILSLETWGELSLGLSAQQSRMTGLFALYSIIAAPVIEEIIFRGFLVVESHRKLLVWAGAVGASLVFAAFHPFLWDWRDTGFAWTFTAKGWFSGAAAFATSLWLYAARLSPWNPARSLLPCFAGHAAKNIGVVAIKGALGFLGGWW